MKVCTLNTHSWLEDDPYEKMERLINWIVEEDFDVIALQEVNQLIESPLVTTDDYFQPLAEQSVGIARDNYAYCISQLLKERGVHYYWSWAPCHIGYDRYQEGLALLMKEAFTPKSFRVSEQADPQDFRTRYVLAGQQTQSPDEPTFYCGHFSWWDSKTSGFAYEWAKVCQQIEQNGKNLQVIMGDFNNPAEVRGEGYDLIREDFQDAFLEAKQKRGEHTVRKAIDGWTQNQEALRIDGVYYQGALAVKDYQVRFDGVNEPAVSDHAAVLVEFERMNKS